MWPHSVANLQITRNVFVAKPSTYPLLDALTFTVNVPLSEFPPIGQEYGGDICPVLSVIPENVFVVL
jgi:hypothetical protein